MKERLVTTVGLLFSIFLGVMLADLYHKTPEVTTDNFHKLFYGNPTKTWAVNKWLGVLSQQNPNDVWITQEIIYDTKPDIIIETGTQFGGGAILWASLLSMVNPEGRVITIDISDENVQDALNHPVFKEKVEFIKASSTASETIKYLTEQVKGKRTLVILDSYHGKDHVLKEMNLYGPLVHKGGYMIVQDSNVGGHPIEVPDLKEGPYASIEMFFEKGGTTNGATFEIDKSRERLYFTMHPNGYLKRIN